ncbi:MAG: hypothetical protein ACK4RK_13650 [Gemmataceae bacterium]
MATATTTSPRTGPQPPVPNGVTSLWLPLGLLALFLTLVAAGCYGLYVYVTRVAASTGQEAHFVLRRFEQPVKLFGQEFEGIVFWLPLVSIVLVLAFVYVVWMYIRDAHTVGWPWASFLGVLRCTVYVVLAGVFLLPAIETWEKTEDRSKVVLFLDLSGSMGQSDAEPRPGVPFDQLPTRLDQVAEFLSAEEIRFIQRIQEKNPVTIYGFGDQLDEEFRVLEKGQSLSREEWLAWLRMDVREWLTRDLSVKGKEALKDHPDFAGDLPAVAKDEDPQVKWANDWLNLEADFAIPSVLSKEDQDKLRARRNQLPAKLELRRLILEGTNVGDSLLTGYNREANNLLAGIIVFSDGRSNRGSAQSYQDLYDRARRAQVPIFAVAVGEDRQRIRLEIIDVQAPEQAPPDDKFPIRVEVVGEGLPNQEFDIYLDVYKPGEDQPALTLKRPDAGQPAPKFEPGDPPHVQVEFLIDPLAEEFASLRNPEAAQPELLQGEWKFVARVPRHARELFEEPFHVSDATRVIIAKKPLRVLLMAGGPSRDYLFLRTLLAREVDRKRAELSVYLQTFQRGGERVQDVEPNRLLTSFPTYLRDKSDPSEKPEEQYYNLDRYDVVIAIDPDWTRPDVQPQLEMLEQWVSKQGGGLIVVAGPINTLQLARGVNAEKLKPLLDLYPVVPGRSPLILDDSQVIGLGISRSANLPWRLHFGENANDFDFLKLDDDPDADVLAGWQAFFGSETPPRRGIFTYYPVQRIKEGASVVATFGDSKARMDSGAEQPYLVTMPYGGGRVVYIGSEEMWRLRMFRVGYHERFWTKLGRYAGAGRLSKNTHRGTLVMSRQFVTGSYVPLEARLFGTDMQPLPERERPQVRLTLPEGFNLPPTTFELKPKPSQGQWEGWFQGRFLAKIPGEYRIEVLIPNSSESLSQTFQVKRSQLELDNTRPDFATLYQIASSVDALRITDPKTRERIAANVRTLGQEAAAADTSSPLLFDLESATVIPEGLTADMHVRHHRGPIHDLWDDGPTIPAHLARETVLFGTGLLGLIAVGLGLAAIGLLLARRPVGAVLCLAGCVALFALAAVTVTTLIPLANQTSIPMTISTVLLVVVGILSAEWLTRKLLKLA